MKKKKLQGFTVLPFHCCVKQFMVLHTCPWFFFFHFFNSSHALLCVLFISYIKNLSCCIFTISYLYISTQKKSFTLLCVLPLHYNVCFLVLIGCCELFMLLLWSSFPVANSLCCSSPCGALSGSQHLYEKTYIIQFICYLMKLTYPILPYDIDITGRKETLNTLPKTMSCH